jgi:hypothetical protein
MARALFIDGSRPEAVMSLLSQFSEITVFCASQAQISQHWMVPRPQGIEIVLARPEMIDTEVQTRYRHTFDAVYLCAAHPAPAEIKFVERFARPGAPIRNAYGDVLAVAASTGIPPGMTDDSRTDDATPFLVAYGEWRYGTDKWIGPLSADLGINSNSVVKMVKGKSYLRWNSSIVRSLQHWIDADIAALQSIKVMGQPK